MARAGARAAERSASRSHSRSMSRSKSRSSSARNARRGTSKSPDKNKHEDDDEMEIDTANAKQESKRSLSRSPSTTKDKSELADEKSSLSKTFPLRVDNLTRNVNADHLSEIFGKFGLVVRVSLVRERVSKVPKGFAFVEFKSHADAESAQDHMHDGWLDGKKVRVRFATDDDRRSRSVGRNSDRNGNKTNANGRRGRDATPRKRSFSPRGRRTSFSPNRDRSPGPRSRQSADSLWLLSPYHKADRRLDAVLSSAPVRPSAVVTEVVAEQDRHSGEEVAVHPTVADDPARAHLGSVDEERARLSEEVSAVAVAAVPALRHSAIVVAARQATVVDVDRAGVAVPAVEVAAALAAKAGVEALAAGVGAVASAVEVAAEPPSALDDAASASVAVGASVGAAVGAAVAAKVAVEVGVEAQG